MMYPELSHDIVGLAMKTQNQYGLGHQERIYHRAFCEELEAKNISFESEPELNVYSISSGKVLGSYRPDLLIENKIIIELKAVGAPLSKFEEQIQSYLCSSTFQVGYLINFGMKPLFFKRFLHTTDRKSWIRPDPFNDPS